MASFLFLFGGGDFFWGEGFFPGVFFRAPFYQPQLAAVLFIYKKHKFEWKAYVILSIFYLWVCWYVIVLIFQ